MCSISELMTECKNLHPQYYQAKPLIKKHIAIDYFYLSCFLRVMDVSHMNRMQTQNIAIVFGPTLLWQQSPGDALAVQTVYQSRIVEFILLEYNELFK